MNPEATRAFHAMLDAHNDAVASMRQSKESLLQASAAQAVAATASDAAFDAAIAANRATVDLLYALNKDTDAK